MSILTKPYTITVWRDEWDPSSKKFAEKRIGIIGTNEMTAQCRALEPTLTRNVNGVKKFSFQMYTQYIDNETGEKTKNPYVDWLVSERKVKLEYDNQWYDFIIKNISENSTTYLNTYSLEDALVQELSKNGFGVTLDEKLMNNMDTAEGLASRVLEETDWAVDSEVFVQTIEEGLVYVTFPAGTYYKVTDQSIANLKRGVTSTPVSFKQGGTALAFYSCCKNKPHRFQFIYLSNGYDKAKVAVDDRGFINIANCQYYIDIPNPGNTGLHYSEKGSYYLPSNWNIVESPSWVDKRGYNDTTISTWYRGKRYGFAQSAEYVPLLQKYCSIYEKDGEIYYGYIDNTYTSPAQIQNVITNSDFKGTTGWVGTYTGPIGNLKNSIGTKVESVYGYFKNGEFISVIDDLTSGNYDNTKSYATYLKVVFPAASGSNKPVLINTGFYDNRTIIKNVSFGEKWCLNWEFYNSNGTSLTTGFDFCLQEVSYNTNLGNYTLGSKWAEFSGTEAIILLPAISDSDFKNKEIKLVISRTSNSEQTVYIKDMQLFRKVLNAKSETINPGDLNTEGVIETKYYLFKESQLDGINDSENIVYDDVVDTIDYTTYLPKYNEDANKVRSITAKESNYFNILQSIAETFECWVILKTRRDSLGGIESKTVCLKNYVGKDNYAAFRYGVNLKDIQRTYESKNIVTKLIVKENSNEYAEDGFCTIARAGANPTGENYIYDFSYFHNMGLLDAGDYIKNIYYEINPTTKEEERGPDLTGTKYNIEYNLQNYVNRIKSLNDKIKPINTELGTLQADLTKYTAELKVQEGLRDSASDGIEETVEDFVTLTGFLPTTISEDSMQEISVKEIKKDDLGNAATIDGKFTVTSTQIGPSNSTSWRFNVNIGADYSKVALVRLNTFPSTDGSVSWNGTELSCISKYAGLTINDSGSNGTEYEDGKRYKLRYTLQKTRGALECIGTHSQSFKEVEIWIDKVKIDDTFDNQSIVSITDDTKEHEVVIYGTYFTNTSDNNPCLCIQPNRGSQTEVTCKISDISLEVYGYITSSKDRSVYFQPTFTITPTSGESKEITKTLSCTIPKGAHSGTLEYSLAIVDTTAPSISNLLTKYAKYQSEYNNANDKIEDGTNGLLKAVNLKKQEISAKKQDRQVLLNHKKALNKLFFETYSRFIQEGTWISEEYVDDDKYYIDAQSVMYNSCYPQVAYSINVLSLKNLPGYEYFDFEIGDKTFVEDEEFFGKDKKEEIIVSELTENLNDPTKNTIKVQNFKNQFQDLFQKITATVQQAQYSTGAYQKAVALAEADMAIKGQFVTEGLEAYGQKLNVAGQTTVVQDENGITLTDSATKDQMRLIGGAIMMSVEDEETGQRKWKTGLTPEGISASLINTGTLNAGNIQIMNINEPVFRWDAYGLSAFDAEWSNSVINAANPYKFVRFDKHGIYGINSNKDAADSTNGISWRPSSADEINRKATFALTWEGLKVTSKNNGTLLIGDSAKRGDDDDSIMSVKNAAGTTTFSISPDGTLLWTPQSTPTRTLYHQGEDGMAPDKPLDSGQTGFEEYDDYDDESSTEWHKIIGENDLYASWSNDGGNTWGNPVRIAGTDGAEGNGIDRVEEWYLATSTNIKPGFYESLENNNTYWSSEATDGTAKQWKNTISDAGHSINSPYLWNNEIVYFTDESKKETGVVLLANTPNSIVSVTEYYSKQNINKISIDTSFDTLIGINDANGEPIWETIIPELTFGETLYNQEVIQFAQPVNGSIYQVSDPAAIGYHGENGTSPYRISIDDDATYVSSNYTVEYDENSKPTNIATISASYTMGNSDATVLTPYIVEPENITGFYALITSDGVYCSKDDNKIQIHGFNDDYNESYGTVTFTLKQNGKTYDTATYKLIRREKGDTGDSGVSPYLLKLSKSSAVIFTAADGILNTEEEKEALKAATMVTASVWLGGEKIAHTENNPLVFNWSKKEGNVSLATSEQVNNDLSTTYLTAMQSDTVVLTCEASYTIDADTVWTDSIDFVIVKQKQGDAAIDCYIESSNGTLFDADNMPNTVDLIARIFQGATELDPNGDQYTYSWYVEGSQDPLDDGNQVIDTKTLRIIPSNYIGKEIYFKAVKRAE